MTFEERLAETFKRTLPKLGPEAREQLAALIQPQSLAIMAGVLSAWVVSHAFGIGEVMDVVIGVVGIAAIGWAVFTGLDQLYEFAKRAYFGKSPQDFEAAADHLAKAVAILGIQAVLAVVFRGARVPKTYRGGRLTLETPPPRTPGLRYTPTIVQDAELAAGEGFTTCWGDITVSSKGTANDRALVTLHEKVHQFLAPKLYVLREYRVGSNSASYVRSSLWRYIEEAMAETIARVGVNGFRDSITGIRFPVSRGYVYLAKGGGYSAAFEGSGLVPEGAGLLYTSMVAGIAVEVRFVATNPRVRQPANAAAH